MTDTSSIPEAVEPVHERGSRAALAGVVFAVLFTIGWVLIRESPSVRSSDEVVIDYFTRPERRRWSLVTGLYVTPLAGIAFIWFMAAFRYRIVRAGGAEHSVLSLVQLVTGTVFVAMIFIAGGAELASFWLADAAAEGAFDVDTARSTLAVGTAMSLVFALRSMAAFIAVSSTRALRAGLFPTWFAILSYVFAVGLMFVATTWRPMMLAISIWVIGASVMVLLSRPNRADPVEA